MDVLADLLERSRARGALFAQTTVTGAWGLSFPAGSGLGVHAMLAGEGFLRLDGHPPLRLAAGDVALVRGAEPHALAATADGPCEPLEAFAARAAVPGSQRRLADAADGEPPAEFLCGAYRFAGDLCSSLLATLDPVVHVRPAAASPLRSALDLLAGEMAHDAPGQQTVLDRLLDVVLVQVLRDWLGRRGTAAPAWFRALDDPAAGAALRAMHADPARAWTVAELADVAGLSRAAFARRFADHVGSTPLEYLTGWRMALARERLRSGERLAAVAGAVGYSSEYAFAAAFKRRHGVAPGRWRARQAAAQAATPSERTASASRAMPSGIWSAGTPE